MRSVVESRNAPALVEPVAGARDRAVERVADGGDDTDDQRPAEVPADDEGEPGDLQKEAEDRQPVGGDADARQDDAHPEEPAAGAVRVAGLDVGHVSRRAVCASCAAP